MKEARTNLTSDLFTDMPYITNDSGFTQPAAACSYLWQVAGLIAKLQEIYYKACRQPHHKWSPPVFCPYSSLSIALSARIVLTLTLDASPRFNLYHALRPDQPWYVLQSIPFPFLPKLPYHNAGIHQDRQYILCWCCMWAQRNWRLIRIRFCRF